MYENIPGESPEIKNRQNARMVKSRLALIACFFVCGFLAVAFKASEIMIFGDKFLKPKVKVAERSQRMEIIDRNGIILATNLKTVSVYANPQEMIEKKDAAQKLAKALRGTDSKYLEKEFNHKKKVFTWVKRNITPTEQKAVNQLGIPGVYFMDDIARVYPQGKLLGHVLGYVDVDNHGLAGIENEFEDLLNFSKGEKLQLSIDVKLQQILREELLHAVQEYKAIGGAGLVLDVNTGEVIALVSLPDFDPNSPTTATADEKFNRATLGTYELGSVMKGFTTAVAIDSGKVKPTTTFDATQSLTIGKRTIHDYHAQKRVLTVTEIMEFSSNVGTARMALMVGNQTLRDYFGKFGLFEPVPIELPERGKPQVQKKWTDIVTATVSFGHGIAVTPAHVARGFQAIVNGGNLHPLTLLKKNPDDPIETAEVIGKNSSDQMREMLRSIVLSGTGRNADAKGYLVGGKTGTADKQVGGKYDGRKVISSFVGAFPINKPKYLIYAVVDEPQEKTKGIRPTAGVVAAPIIKNFVDRAGPLLGLEPDFETMPPQPETYTQTNDSAFQIVHN